ncbi:MAG: hypothetical protein EOP54_25345 [Sphingobacteriales bacterium]|nr:MAG: hypothetical protein EOP54_25345 [Sphingobacteriales bacterium]
MKKLILFLIVAVSVNYAKAQKAPTLLPPKDRLIYDLAKPKLSLSADSLLKLKHNKKSFIITPSKPSRNNKTVYYSKMPVVKMPKSDSRMPVADVDMAKIARETPEYSGADIKALIDITIEAKLEASMASGRLEPITTKDLLKATKTHRASTLEWLASARNYALYSNESGLYDEILKYLKIKK